MNHTVALPGSMIWMGIRLSSGSRPQSPKGPSSALTQSVFCSYGPVVEEWPEMLCAWSSQYPHRPIPPDQSRSVEVNGTGSVVVPCPLFFSLGLGLGQPVVRFKLAGPPAVTAEILSRSFCSGSGGRRSDDPRRGAA